MSGRAELFSTRALELAPRALPLLTSRSRLARAEASRVAFAIAASEAGSPALERLRALPSARLEPHFPAESEPLNRELPGELLLECDRTELAALANELPEAVILLAAQSSLDAEPAEPRMMGIVNVTPDSFSDGGRFLDPATAVSQGLELARQGAQFIDVGGESTRPGAQPVPVAEQLRRIGPVVEQLAAKTEVPISIDTTSVAVARAALDRGVAMVNDISAGLDGGGMLELVAARGCQIVLMHRLGKPATMQAAPSYADPVAEVAAFLRQRVAACLAAGIQLPKILLDPGIGFGKRLPHNLTLLRRLGELRSLGLPLLVGVSRKSFIGHLTGAEKQEDWRTESRADRPEERIGGTAAAVALAVAGGASVLRVHDVRTMAEAAAVAAAIQRPSAHAASPR